MLASSAWQALSAGATFTIGAMLVIRSSSYFGVPWRRALFLYIWHSLFCVVYLLYSVANVADATLYYERSLSYSGGFGVASPFVYLLTSVFSQFLGFSYLGAFLVFNIFGSLGLIAVYGAFRISTQDKSATWRRLAFALVLLPSISFWSSAIGKDAISFMAVGFAIWAAIDLRRRFLLMTLAILAMFLVRPHMGALMASALAMSVVFGMRVPLVQRVFLGGAVLLVSAFAVPFAMNYAGLGDSASPDDVVDYMEQRQGHNMSGGGGVDISSMNLPAKLLTYLLRPLPHEAHSIPAFAASLDNVVLALLLLFGGVRLWRGRKSVLPGDRIFLWIYALSAWLVLAMTTANLGISVRQKWMFLPALMFLFLSYIGRAPKSRART